VREARLLQRLRFRFRKRKLHNRDEVHA
jgi:hypothetical protein